MMNMMNALLLRKYNIMEHTRIDTPSYAPDEVLVKVRAAGICGSDVHGMDGSTGRRIPPLVMGHEASGEIAAMGRAVDRGAGGYAVGDRVTFDSTLYCRDCSYCRQGKINFCENRRVLGVACDEYSRNGAFAEYVTVPARILYRLPDSMSFHEGAMVEPLSIAVHAAAITPIGIGDTALVLGAGVIGLLTLQVLRLAGCTRVFAADIEESRLEKARELGAAETFNSASVSLPDEIIKRSGGLGADAVFDAVGLSETVNTAILCLKKGGTAAIIGNYAPKVDFPLQRLVSRQIRVQGSNASAGEYPACIELIRSGRIQLKPLLSKVAPLAEGPLWFDRLYKGGSGLLKVILEP